MTVTIQNAIVDFLESVRLARSKNTFETYSFALQSFELILKQKKVDVTASVEEIPELGISWFAGYLKNLSPATEQLYLQAVKGFYQYVDAERLAEINLSRVHNLIRQRARRPGVRLPQFPAEDIERVLDFAVNQTMQTSEDAHENLRAMRDRAFLLTLADTGLRVHEACKLRRGDIDWNEGRAVIVGKGNKQAVVRFTSRAMRALKEYLSLRAKLDGGSGKQLTALPLFARHDKGSGGKIKPITPTTGRNIVAERAAQILGSKAKGRITPHSFRHYFVSTILRASGNLKLAQALARHENIQITQRYAHLNDDELDKGYYEIFERKS